MQRTLSHSLREIADQLRGHPVWASVCWRAALQLDAIYALSGLTVDELPDLTGVSTLEEARDRGERALLVATLYRSGGNKVTAAKWLNISRESLYKALNKHNLLTGKE